LSETLTGECNTSEFGRVQGLQMEPEEWKDLIVLRELAVKPMRKLGPLQAYIEDFAGRGLVERTRAGWTRPQLAI
jgi:hypothetical protein